MPEFVNEGPGFRGWGAKIRAPDLLGVMRGIGVSDAVVFTAPVRIVCCDLRVRNQGITEHEFQDLALTYGQASSRHFFVSSSHIHQRTIPQRGVTPGIISLRYRGPQRSEYQSAHLGDHQTLRAACAPRTPMSHGEMDRATQYHQ